MPFEFLRDTVLGNGFAAQYASRFDDAFEGVARIMINGIQVPIQFAPSALVQYYSVLCFNKSDETDPHHEMLMWSLYANKNKGVRIVLDLPWSGFFLTPYTVMDNVRYEANIPAISKTSKSVNEMLESTNCGNAIDNFDWITAMYFVKHPCWEWEKEYRVVIVNSEIPGKVSKAKSSKSEEFRYCAEFMQPYIVGVDFGINLWRDEQVKILNVINEIRAERGDLIFRRPVCLANQKIFEFEAIDSAD